MHSLFFYYDRSLGCQHRIWKKDLFSALLRLLNFSFSCIIGLDRFSKSFFCMKREQMKIFAASRNVTGIKTMILPINKEVL